MQTRCYFFHLKKKQKNSIPFFPAVTAPFLCFSFLLEKENNSWKSCLPLLFPIPVLSWSSKAISVKLDSRRLHPHWPSQSSLIWPSAAADTVITAFSLGILPLLGFQDTTLLFSSYLIRCSFLSLFAHFFFSQASRVGAPQGSVLLSSYTHFLGDFF